MNILDEAGDPQPSGVIGEVAVQSPGAGEPCHADDQRAFKHVDGWIRVNDLGWLDDEGRLYISGRKGSIINVAGQKVQPSEVEAVLCRHPAVKQGRRPATTRCLWRRGCERSGRCWREVHSA